MTSTICFLHNRRLSGVIMFFFFSYNCASVDHGVANGGASLVVKKNFPRNEVEAYSPIRTTGFLSHPPSLYFSQFSQLLALKPEVLPMLSVIN